MICVVVFEYFPFSELGTEREFCNDVLFLLNGFASSCARDLQEYDAHQSVEHSTREGARCASTSHGHVQ